MSLSAILDVAIGLVFIYLLLGLLASIVQEMVAGWLEKRGKGLKLAIGELLAGRLPSELGEDSLFRKVFDHSLVRSVSAGRLPSYVAGDKFSLAIIEALKDGSQSPLFTQIETTIARMPDSAAKESLSALLSNARGDIDAFKTGVEKWFDDAMDRATGIYKRNVQYVLLAIGAFLAVTLNVDSVTIARTLWTDRDTRAAVVAAAQKYMETACPGQAAPAKPGEPAKPREQAKPGEPAPPPPLTDECSKKLADSAKAQLDSLPLPIGWAAAQAHYAERNKCVFKLDKDAKPALPLCDANVIDLIYEQIRMSGWFWTILGWVISALAVSMGAPFWFDTLQRLLNLRAAGVKPERRT